MNDLSHVRDSWWLASLGNTLIWARLRIREAGTAEVLDSDGNTLSYDSEDTARSQLFDAEFVEYDGLDEEDALVRGFSLHEVQPPQAGSDSCPSYSHLRCVPNRFCDAHRAGSPFVGSTSLVIQLLQPLSCALFKFSRPFMQTGRI